MSSETEKAMWKFVLLYLKLYSAQSLTIGGSLMQQIVVMFRMDPNIMETNKPIINTNLDVATQKL